MKNCSARSTYSTTEFVWRNMARSSEKTCLAELKVVYAHSTNVHIRLCEDAKCRKKFIGKIRYRIDKFNAPRWVERIVEYVENNYVREYEHVNNIYGYINTVRVAYIDALTLADMVMSSVSLSRSNVARQLIGLINDSLVYKERVNSGTVYKLKGQMMII
jgi:hypothetical protein